ncbi:MAG TPA: beta-ketoacyl synthase N-terminal-like domain-containing protein, partial [Desulfobacterales bacterium]|nr:beta-ketoacyl synthase N-terminal-like domain-containing protein [Desulfobacterales bacterium]
MTLNAPIAIIGMGCLFPKSPGLKEYWRLIFHGTDGISEVPETHWLPDEYFDKDPKKPDHVCCSRGGFLSPVSFDPTEFGIPPSILEATDTSQLLGLVAAKMALEDSGYGEGKTYDRDRTSVILGVTGTQELVIPLSGRLGRPNWRKALSDSDIPPQKIEEIITKIADTYPSWQESSFPGLLGNVVAGRIANRLDLGGTNCVVDAACASSLGALNIAILELITGRSDMVITGGVDTLNDIFMHMCFARSLVLSPTGDARPFSKYADGTVLGEGVGILVLKRLEDAERDNDRIYCIIKGLGSSSDGRSQSVYSPNENGQIKALQAAYRNAGIDPSTVKLMEAHGTGTRVGDLVEFRALSRVFGKSEKTDKCALGSVKSMIGHTKAAAGTAAIIKAALSLWNKVLPPTLKAEEPDPKLNISESPFYLSRETRPWLSNKKHPRRAAVSSFGFGGSNFHVVLEEHDKKKTHVSWDGSVEIFAFSATTWQKVAENLQHLKIDFDNGLSELEFSNKASETRAVFSFVDPFRLLLVFERSVTGTRNSIENFSALLTDALNTLESNGSKNFYRTRNIFWGRSEKPGKLAFAFPGQGSQYVGMGRDLVCGFPEAIQILNDFNEKFENRPLLSDFIYPNPATGKEEREIQEKVLRRTDIAQPAIGAISLAMLKILQKFGIKADATCGHSYGELPALYAAGWMDIDALAYLSITRGKLMAAAGKDPEKNNGTMLAVKAPLEAIADLISENKLDVVLANKNSPDQGVLSGSIDAIARAKMICDQKGFGAIHLPVSAAFHSRLVKSAQKPFMQALKKVEITAGDIPVFSNTTGKAYPTEPEKAKKLLGEQILCPVDFVSEIKNLYRMGVRTFVEVGPKSILTGLIQSIITDEYVNIIPLDASIGKGYGTADFARAICHLASIGYPVELNHWESLSKKPIKQRMSIPLSGANYRAELKTETGRKKQRETLFHHPSRQVTDPEGGLHDAKLLAGAGLETEKKQGEFVGNRSFTQTADTVSDPKTGVFNVNPIFENRNIMDKADSQKNPEFILDALKVVQEGLKSIQFLQMQTAETHKKFLETQAQAGRTLQEMMENTRRLAEASMGLNPSEFLPKKAHSTGRKPSSVAPYSNPEKNSGFCDSTKISTVSRAPEVHADASGEGSNVEKLKENVELSNKEFETVEQVLLSVVGELTGYPVEMLSPDMDIEADLGIDSIKRVEILSAMEEKMPGLPLSPETMASMKTLRQITEHLVKAGKNDSISVAEENAKKPSEKNRSSHLRTETVEQVLLSVVGELTGYP